MFIPFILHYLDYFIPRRNIIRRIVIHEEKIREFIEISFIMMILHAIFLIKTKSRPERKPGTRIRARITLKWRLDFRFSRVQTRDTGSAITNIVVQTVAVTDTVEFLQAIRDRARIYQLLIQNQLLGFIKIVHRAYSQGGIFEMIPTMIHPGFLLRPNVLCC